MIDFIKYKYNKIILKVKKPDNIDAFSFNSLLKNRIFINDIDNVELFGFHYPINTFIYDNICYVTLDTEFTFSSDVYKPNNCKIFINKYIIVEDIEYGLDYSTISIDMFIPDNNYTNQFIRTVYLKECNDIKNNYLIFEDYAQIFTSSFENVNGISIVTDNK